MSRKIERLINLTIALLATKRFLTKSEIFNALEGYEGSAQTKERMFERDKDDLRNLGIDIEVGSFDPLFDDEAGYRIRPQSYALDLGEITGQQIALLSLAAQAWSGAALDDAAARALNKLRSLGVDSDLDSIPAITARLTTTHPDFHSITTAISLREEISFSYRSPELDLIPRQIQPYAVATRNSFWYVSGHDLTRDQIRTFRLDRIDGEITRGKESKSFEIPVGFNVFQNSDDEFKSYSATIDIRKGKAQILRAKSSSSIDMGEWDRISYNYFDSQQMIDLILWHGQDAILREPQSLKNQLIETLHEIVRIHV